MELTATFSRDQYERALAAWDWIGLGRRVPVFTSLFGDVFLESHDGFWWLDVVRGRLSKPWEGREELERALAAHDGQRRYLRGRLVLDAELHGLLPAPGQVYGFRVAPVLGGHVGADNLDLVDFTTRMHNSGQMHGWLRHWASRQAPASDQPKVR